MVPANVLDARVDRLMRAYPLLYLACHRRHTLADESGRRLTAQQASVLDHLDEGRPPRVSQLAAHMDVTEATMSIHLSRLEQGGYIKRVRDASDGRGVLLRLTAKGRSVKRESSVFDPALTRELICLVPPGEIESALEGLETLARAAEALMRRRHFERKKKSP